MCSVVVDTYVWTLKFVMPTRGLRAAAGRDILQEEPYQDASGDGDVVLLVRQWMASTEQSQRPKLVLPDSMHGLASRFVSDIRNSKHVVINSVEAERKSGLYRLASFLEGNYSTYERGVSYLRQVACPAAITTPAPIAFLEAAPRFAFRREEFDAPLEEMLVPREMNVFYPRRRVIVDVD